MLTVLIDGDLISYPCAAASENDPEDIAILRAYDVISRLLDNIVPDNYRVFLGHKVNFRKTLSPDYKANRTTPAPKHRNAINEYLFNEHKAESLMGAEADDLLGMNQKQDGSTIIASYDKDLLQVPGKHYNWHRDVFTDMDHYTASYHFYSQLLIGDPSDNVKGVLGIGKKKAEKILYGLTEEEMFDKCRELYDNDERFLLSGRLLWIWKSPYDVWSPTSLTSTENFKLDLDSVFGSTTKTQEESAPLLEATTSQKTMSGTLQDGISLDTSHTLQEKQMPEPNAALT